MEKIEYRVRPVTRYVVTRFAQDANGSESSQKGEYDNGHVAYSVAYALARHEHTQLGWPLDDSRIIYPPYLPDYIQKPLPL